MPIDHGNEGLKLAARVIRSPTIHQLREDPQQMGIQDFAPNVASIRPPVLRAVQRRRPADVDPGLIPDRRDDQPWPAVCVGRLRELMHLPNLEEIFVGYMRSGEEPPKGAAP